jgi:hypothetical protein
MSYDVDRYTECRYAKRHYDECRYADHHNAECLHAEHCNVQMFMLRIVMLRMIILNVIMMSIAWLIVVAPYDSKYFVCNRLIALTISEDSQCLSGENWRNLKTIKTTNILLNVQQKL